MSILCFLNKASIEMYCLCGYKDTKKLSIVSDFPPKSLNAVNDFWPKSLNALSDFVEDSKTNSIKS